MESLKPIGDAINAPLPEIMQTWEAATECEPWLGLSPEFRTNNLSGVIRGLVEVALSGDSDRAALLEKLRAAAEHGQHRLEIGLAEDVVFAEYRLLRRALWNFIQANYPPPVAQEAIMRLDASTTLATIASLRGYHRPSLEEGGDWPRPIEQLADRWPMTG